MPKYTYWMGLGFFALQACSVLVDNALSTRRSDSGTAVDSSNSMDQGVTPDGAGPEVRCGDGRREGSELCDDNNQTSGDGCDANCVPTCASDEACADQNTCNGTEICGAAEANGSRRCGPGTAATDGTSCTLPSGSSMCRAGLCGNCGNGQTDAGEQCDDRNIMNGDGCDNDCTYSCEGDNDCSNADVCDGMETCTIATHTCVPGEPLTCDDENPCSVDSCSRTAGCVYDVRTNDADGDGHYRLSTCTGADDCDDTRDERFPGAPETCADAVDKNCDGMPGTASTPTWYIDCDRDGYAANTTGSVTQCNPPAAPGVCSGGQWVTRAPTSSATIDCQDQLATVNPGITAYSTATYVRTNGLTSYDYTCDSVITRQYTQDFHSSASGYTASCGSSGPFVLCGGEQWWVASSLPACGTSATRSYCGYVNQNGLLLCRRNTATTTVACR